MGRYHQGVVGDFSGKVGPVIGSSWRGVRYIKGRSRPVKNRKVTDKVEKQRAKFKLASDFITSISGLLAISYTGFKDGITARNSILANVIRQAITGEYPDLRIEYSKIEMASGSLSGALGASASSTQPGKIDFTWKNDSGIGNAMENDKPFLIVFCERLGRIYYTIADAGRSDAAHTVEIGLFSGEQVHTWFSFVTANGKDVARSVYTGLVKVA